MTHRRQRISFGIKYGTSSQQLEQIPEIIKDVIGNTKGVTFERCYLEKITEKGYNFLMSYDIVNPEYENSLQINQTIYLTIIKRLEKENIKFALPSHWIIEEEEKNQ
jgi:small-conductance mechanosensitive channel